MPRDPVMGKLTPEAFKQAYNKGRMYVTMQSVKTDARYTYRIVKNKQKDLCFVSYLRGANNESDYQYLGVIIDHKYSHSPKSRIAPTNPVVKGFVWIMHNLDNPKAMEQVEIWNSGLCVKCGRLLTDPDSIALGMGPTCRS